MVTSQRFSCPRLICHALFNLHRCPKAEMAALRNEKEGRREILVMRDEQRHTDTSFTKSNSQQRSKSSATILIPSVSVPGVVSLFLHYLQHSVSWVLAPHYFCAHYISALFIHISHCHASLWERVYVPTA